MRLSDADRDYFYRQSDCKHVHDPEIYNVNRIKNKSVVMCQCCLTTVNSDDKTLNGMIFSYDRETEVLDRHKIKTVYCAKCLNHIGIVSCPSIRGVPAHVNVNPDIVAQIMDM
jgi:hypothetical protein